MVFSANNYDRRARSMLFTLDCDPKKDRTRQEFKQEADVNVIVGRILAGQVPQSVRDGAAYGDFTAAPDSYHSALNLIQETDRAWRALPVRVRDAYRHDRGKLLDDVAAAADDPELRKELEELGVLAKRPPAPAEPVVAPVEPVVAP